jgi:hypothetical protein
MMIRMQGNAYLEKCPRLDYIKRAYFVKNKIFLLLYFSFSLGEQVRNLFAFLFATNKKKNVGPRKMSYKKDGLFPMFVIIVMVSMVKSKDICLLLFLW